MDRHRTDHHLALASLESLEDRLALSTVPANPMEAIVDLKAGPVVGAVYTEFVDYVQSGSKGTFTSPENSQVAVFGTGLGVDVRFGPSNFAADVAQLQAQGMQITVENPAIGLVEGVIPIFQLPSTVVLPNEVSLTPVYRPTTNAGPTDTSTLVAEITAKGGPALGSIYQEYANYEQAGGTGTFSPPEAAQITISGTSVGVDLKTSVANSATMITAMKNLGMQVTATVSTGQVVIIEGLVPIGQLPAVANNGLLIGMNPSYKAHVN